MQNEQSHSLEGWGAGDDLHEQILAEGQSRFPEESYQQLLRVGASPEEALGMLGYSADRKRLAESEAEQS